MTSHPNMHEREPFTSGLFMKNVGPVASSNAGESSMRLQRYIARSGGPGRRAAEKLIAQGRIRVNGQVVTQMGVKVTPGVDRVMLDDTELKLPDSKVVIALNKPVGYECSMRPETLHPSAAELIPTDRFKGLVHVGRLDVATTGLILFTNDGDLCARLLMPRYEVKKAYRALVRGWLTDDDLARLRKGVKWHDVQYSPPQVDVVDRHEIARTSRRVHRNTIVLPRGAQTDIGVIKSMERFEHVRLPRRTSTLHVVVHEGHNHEVRNMFTSVGHPVIALKRLSFGPIGLGSIPVGGCRRIEGDELARLYQAAGLPAPSAQELQPKSQK